MEFVLFWLGFSLVVGVLASNRGRTGIGWFFLSLVISPLIAGLLVLASDNLKTRREAPSYQTHAPCPKCAEPVLREAIKCKHCGSDITPQPLPRVRTFWEQLHGR